MCFSGRHVVSYSSAVTKNDEVLNDDQPSVQPVPSLTVGEGQRRHKLGGLGNCLMVHSQSSQ